MSTPTARTFVPGGRDRGVLTAAIGDDYAGTLVSDFYGVSTSYPGQHQYCWAHLPRDVDELVGQHPTAAAAAGWGDSIHQLYRRALGSARDPDPPSGADTARRARRRWPCSARRTWGSRKHRRRC